MLTSILLAVMSTLDLPIPPGIPPPPLPPLGESIGWISIDDGIDYGIKTGDKLTEETWARLKKEARERGMKFSVSRGADGKPWVRIKQAPVTRPIT